MPKYLVQFRYTPDGLKGLQKEGGSKRRVAVKKGIEGAGGRMECFYFTFGKYDGFGVAEFPNEASAAAFSVAVGASGTVSLHTSAIVEPEELDAASRMKMSFRGAGNKK